MSKSMVATAAQWKKAKRDYTVQLPSGTVVVVRVPNLKKILMGGELPNELRPAAMLKMTGVAEEGLTPEQAKQMYDFDCYVTMRTVVKPQVTMEMLDDLPYPDVALISAIGTMQADPENFEVEEDDDEEVEVA